jgi:glutamate dehydrogenase
MAKPLKLHNSGRIRALLPTFMRNHHLVSTPQVFLTRLANAIEKKFTPEGPLEDLRRVLGLYFQTVTPDDLDLFSLEDWVSLFLEHWQLGLTRHPGETALRLVNLPVRRHASQAYTVALTVNDDMPFLVDSLTLAGRQEGLGLHLTVHPVFVADRNGEHRLDRIGGLDGEAPGSRESWILTVFDRIQGTERLARLEKRIRDNLSDVLRVFEDSAALRDRVTLLGEDIIRWKAFLPEREVEEARDFLEWLTQDWFTFLGYRRYALHHDGDELRLAPERETGLGILRTRADHPPEPKALAQRANEKALSQELLIITKTNAHSTVHRSGPIDYIGLRRFDARGRVVGEDRILGLFSPLVFKCPPQEIPVVRLKREAVLRQSGLAPESHAGRHLRIIFDTLPLSELLEASIDQLVELTFGVLRLQERHLTRLFLRPDVFGRYLSCLIYLPRENYTARARESIEKILVKGLHGHSIESDLWISDSVLARLHATVHTETGRLSPKHLATLELEIQDASRSWNEKLRLALADRLGEERGLPLFDRYRDSFPEVYRDDVKPQAAVYDLLEIEQLKPAQALRLSLYRPKHASSCSLRLKIFRLDQSLAISDTLPILESTGFRVVSERPYEVPVPGIGRIWIHDFELELPGSTDRALERREALEELFLAIWTGLAANDDFNRLAIDAELSWREIMLLRSICKYLIQTGIPFTPANMSRALASHFAITRLLVRWFHVRFDPFRDSATRESEAQACLETLRTELESVESSDDDRILRAYLGVLGAMVRTSFFQRPLRDPEGYRFLSYKLDSSRVPDLPLPRPLYEIFVYAPQVEGIHLRGGRIARGGIRWSDRSEDFRTEVLGLMKAQMVKNTVIVPVGAKGGFYVKQPPKDGNRDRLIEEARRCYRTFIQGLLTLTDNIVSGQVQPPKRVVRYDEDDPYLVVAADKGTATFSDLANAIASDFHFWLGDAFASGGSIGYDHKKMAITARGVWESVRRHFRELGVDPDREPVTVVGIGDLSGDVFGNGMLRSPHLKLIGAFNHQHIFIDPHPDPRTSFEERQRLFDMPRSSWTDYRSDLLSPGGGIYPRSAKSIRLSPEARSVLGTEAASVTPTELIRTLLAAPVDLLWNGGIGTYVKAQTETQADVGDRSNDALRLNGHEIRARVVAEGGNLGFTQLGRVEYALNGGRINTDFIDNSAGVDTSDHEVNIKILLNVAAEERRAIVRHRERLLHDMTNDIAEHVLRHNYDQAQALSVLEFTAPQRLDEHRYLVRKLEQRHLLNPALEGLPPSAVLAQRRNLQRGLTRPELAVLLAYGKIALAHDLQDSDIHQDPTLSLEIERYFPSALRKRYTPFMRRHPLARNIITTEITNHLVNHMGPTFATRLQEEIGATSAEIVRAFVVSQTVTGTEAVCRELEALPASVPPALSLEAFTANVRLLRHLTRWLLLNGPRPLNVSGLIATLAPGVAAFETHLLDCLPEPLRKSHDARVRGLTEAGLPEPLAQQLTIRSSLYPVFDLVSMTENLAQPLPRVASFYFRIGQALSLDWLDQAIEKLTVQDFWQAEARISLRENLYGEHRRLTTQILGPAGEQSFETAFAHWSQGATESLGHYRKLGEDMRAHATHDYAMLSIAVHSLRNLAGS